MTQQPDISRNPFSEMPTTSNNPTSGSIVATFPAPAPSAPAPLPKNITVEVSGSRFCIVNSLFKHIEKLHWKKNGDTLRLNANADVFEMILQYFLFNSLPDTNALSSRKATELVELVSPLDVQSVKQLVEHVENFLATKKTSSSSSFLRRRLPSLSSMSSRNKTGSLQVKKSKSNESSTKQSIKKEANNTATTAIPTQINATTGFPPPPQQVAVLHKQQQPRRPQAIHRSSVSSLPTSVIRSSSSSSDGSISRLSQPSYFSSRTNDENVNYSSTLALTENDMLVENLPVLPDKLADSQTMYPRMTEFDTSVVTYPAEPTTTLFAEKDFNARQATAPSPRQQPLEASVKDSTITSSKDEGDSAENNSPLTQKDKKKKKKSKPFFRNVFRGDRNQRKMTHADWCSSEYVL